jgi:hypothetical protein
VTALGAEELARAVGCVSTTSHARALGLLAYQVIAAMADAHSLSCDRRLLRARVANLKIKAANAKTGLGDVLSMLEHGPHGATEAACLSAFAAHGFITTLSELPDSEKPDAAERLVGRLDFLELATEFRIVACLRELLVTAERDIVTLWRQALFQAVLRDDVSSTGVDGPTRARNTLRMTALAQVRGEESTLLLRSLRDCARDAALRALAAGLLSEPLAKDVASSSCARVAGIAAAPSRSLPAALLRWLTGFAALQALQRLLFWLIFVRRELELELRDGALWAHWHTTFWGQTVRSKEACYELQRVTGAFRRARYALLRSVVGVLSLSLGVLIGGYLLFDGARGEAPWLLVVGPALIATGAAVDLVLNVLWPARDARVDLQVDLREAASLRVGRVSQADADRLLEALSVQISERGQ